MTAFAGFSIPASAKVDIETDYIGSSSAPETFTGYNYSNPANGSWTEGNLGTTIGSGNYSAITNVNYNSTSNVNYSSLEDLLAAYPDAADTAAVEAALEDNQTLTDNGDGTYTVTTTTVTAAEYFDGEALVVRKRGNGTRTATFTATNAVTSGRVVFKSALGTRNDSYHGGSVTLNNAAGAAILTVTFPNGNTGIKVATGDKTYTTSNSTVRNNNGYGTYIDVVIDLDELTVTGTYKSRRTTGNALETQNINATLPEGTTFGGLSVTSKTNTSNNNDTMIDNTQLYSLADGYAVTATDSETATVSVDKTAVLAGDTVTVTAAAKEGYVNPVITVTGNTSGDSVSVNANGEFTMPEEDVTVTATASLPGQVDNLIVSYRTDTADAETEVFRKTIPLTDTVEGATVNYYVAAYVNGTDGKIYKTADKWTSSRLDYSRSTSITADGIVAEAVTLVEGAVQYEEYDGSEVYVSRNAPASNGEVSKGSKAITVAADGVYTLTVGTAVAINGSSNRTYDLSIRDGAVLADDQACGGYPTVKTFTDVALKAGDIIDFTANNSYSALDYILFTKTSIFESWTDLEEDPGTHTATFRFLTRVNYGGTASNVTGLGFRLVNFADEDVDQTTDTPTASESSPITNPGVTFKDVPMENFSSFTNGGIFYYDIKGIPFYNVLSGVKNEKTNAMGIYAVPYATINGTQYWGTPFTSHTGEGELYGIKQNAGGE